MTSNTYIVALSAQSGRIESGDRDAHALAGGACTRRAVPTLSARTRSSTGAIRSGCARGPLQCCLRAVLGEPSSAITAQAGDQVCPEGNRVVIITPIHAEL